VHPPLINFGHASHTGRVRKVNEDNLIVSPELGLWVVADGMGGHNAGERASALAVMQIERSIRQGLSLTQAIAAAHDIIRSEAYGSNMGTTVVALKLNQLHYEIGWVGDSRAYLWDGALRQLTTDHSYVQMLLNAGIIAPHELSRHPMRNVISQALGVGGNDGATISIETISGELAEGQGLLLCSDGLYGELDDSQIAAILNTPAAAQTQVEGLIQAALETGGKDNITVVFLKVESGEF
jgi:serine/threonine protein phosphatase PrpC